MLNKMAAAVEKLSTANVQLTAEVNVLKQIASKNHTQCWQFGPYLYPWSLIGTFLKKCPWLVPIWSLFWQKVYYFLVPHILESMRSKYLFHDWKAFCIWKISPAVHSRITSEDSGNGFCLHETILVRQNSISFPSLPMLLCYRLFFTTSVLMPVAWLVSIFQLSQKF